MLRKRKLWEIPVVNFFDRFIFKSLVTINCCDRLICTRFLGKLIIHWLRSAADCHYYVCAFSCAIKAEETQSFHENHQLRMTQIIKHYDYIYQFFCFEIAKAQIEVDWVYFLYLIHYSWMKTLNRSQCPFNIEDNVTSGYYLILRRPVLLFHYYIYSHKNSSLAFAHNYI